MQLELESWLLFIGFFAGTLGTLIGAGGGFILVPILVFLYPDYNPESITSISLAVVFFNALSGTLSYARIKRIDYKSGLVFSIAIVPGAIAGALSVYFISIKLFNAIFGSILVMISVYLLLKPAKNVEMSTKKNDYRSFSNIALGVVLSVFVGYLSSLLGIGGGIIHVPMLVYLLHYPVHIATATSQFILAITAFVGALTHLAHGAFSQSSVHLITYLSIGVIIGAQCGAFISRRVQGILIIRSLAIALIFVGIRVLYAAVS